MTDAADLALQIESLFSSATDNVCSCGTRPEDHCRYCHAWAVALKKTEKLLEEALQESA